jgi:hypothetical protein
MIYIWPDVQGIEPKLLFLFKYEDIFDMWIISFSVPDSVHYDLRATSITEDSFQVTWKVSIVVVSCCYMHVLRICTQMCRVT